MPSGGFGNLIALPLQKAARENDNSVFVDENFIPYQDQWQYISSVKRISKLTLDKYLSELTDGSEVGEVANFSENKKPWIQTTEANLKKEDLPETLIIVKANMLYIEKMDLSSKAINKIKRLATFKNPDFYKA